MKTQNYFLMKVLFFITVISVMLISCDCDESEDDLHFSGIVYMSENGMVLGTSDGELKDWTLEHDWHPKVEMLFTNLDIAIARNIPCENAWIGYGYPNPASEMFSLNVQVGEQGTFEYIVVNEELDVFYRDEKELVPGSHLFTVNLLELHEQALIEKDEYIRMYYRVIMNETEYRGHGDILFK